MPVFNDPAEPIRNDVSAKPVSFLIAPYNLSASSASRARVPLIINVVLPVSPSYNNATNIGLDSRIRDSKIGSLGGNSIIYMNHIKI